MAAAGREVGPGGTSDARPDLLVSGRGVRDRHSSPSKIQDRGIKLAGLREYSSCQITIQCSEGSPATGQHPRNDNCHDIGEGMISSGSPVESGNSIVGMKNMFNMTTRSKYIINIPALKESIPNSSDKCSRVVFSLINLFLLSSKRSAY
jgi:hypothetical protein